MATGIASSSAANNAVEKWCVGQGITLALRAGFLTATATPGTARYCRVHNQHRPHLTVVTPWFVLPSRMPGAVKESRVDGRFLWICPTGYVNLQQALEDVLKGRGWSNYYSPNEKGLAVFAKKFQNTEYPYPTTELRGIPWA